MTKVELASYLVSLHTLLEAQSKGQHSIPSTTLADEYNRTWDQLKQEIANEARQRQKYDERAEGGAQIEGDLAGGSVEDRLRRDPGYEA